MNIPNCQTLLHSQDPFLIHLNYIVTKHFSDEELRASTLHKYLNHSRSGFYQKLKSKAGITPSHYLNKMRVMKSCILLTSSSMTIREVAFAVGYSDPNYYSRVFKAWKGISPKSFRSQWR